jgi:hypothetical protein
MAAYRAIRGRPFKGRQTMSAVAARREPRLIADRRTSRAEWTCEWLMLMSLTRIPLPRRLSESS